jgi:tetratricopeptide (TPR) repeat protein
MRKAAEMAPRVGWTWVNLAWMEEQLGWEDLASTHYRKIFCSSPWYQDSPFFGQTGLRRQVMHDGCPAEGSAQSNAPAGGYTWSGWTALKSGDLEAAEQAFESAIQAEPRDASAYALLGLARQRAGQDEQAWKDIQTAIFVSESSAGVYFTAAQVAYSQGKEEQAVEYLSKAFDLLTQSQASQRFYFAAYNQVSPPNDVSPYTVRTGLPIEQHELLMKWVAHLQEAGESDKAREVLQWIERNASR